LRQDDRTAKARLRDAAIELVARDGADGLTARAVAEAAGVSPGLVAHHFGSMDGLQAACDHHVAVLVREAKQDAMAQGAALDPLAALRDSGTTPLLRYLARRLGQEAPAVAGLVDELVDDAEGYLAQGEEAGLIRPCADPRGRAVVVVLWSLGGLVLHEHLHRLLGVDLTDPDLAEQPTFANYAGPVAELYGNGLLTPAFAAQLRESFAATAPTTA
jgi:AcrR family transcriptional regulator